MRENDLHSTVYTQISNRICMKHKEKCVFAGKINKLGPAQYRRENKNRFAAFILTSFIILANDKSNVYLITSKSSWFLLSVEIFDFQVNADKKSSVFWTQNRLVVRSYRSELIK